MQLDSNQLVMRRGPVMTHTTAMEKDKARPVVRRPDVLKKLNKENLLMIERGLLGDLPDRLKPHPFVPRSRSTDLEVAKPLGILSSCLPVIPDSPISSNGTLSDGETVSPIKKSFSFRDKFPRISFFGKEKEKPKCKTIVEDDKANDGNTNHVAENLKRNKDEYDYKSNKRSWFFRNKDVEKRNKDSPIYQRSKSFEFLPRAIEEQEEEKQKGRLKKNSLSYAFGSSDTMGEAWTSNESLEYISNVYYDNEDGVFLKSIKEFPSESSNYDSSVSTVTSASSANVVNIFKTESVQDLLDEFNKAVDMFSENYLSDCEPYTKSSKKMPVEEKRKSSSFSTLPSPRVVHVTKASELSEDFKKELSRALSVKRNIGGPCVKNNRRGSVTDWFVLEDHAVGCDGKDVNEAKHGVNEANKYRKGQKKSMNRVRRISSTKYVIGP